MVDDAIAALDNGVAAARAVDVDALDDHDTERFQTALIGTRVQLLVISTRTARHWERSGAWRSDGSKSAAARFARDHNWSLADARRDLRHGRALDAMPHTAAALAAARIGPAHLDLLAAANTPIRAAAFADDEAWLVEQCTRHRFAEAKKIIQYWCQRVDPDGCELHAGDLLDKTTLTVATTLDGCVHVQGLLDPVGGATFAEALRRIEHDIYLVDRAKGIERSSRERRAAALVEMAVRATTAPKSGKRPEPLVMILCGHESTARICELSTGTVIAPNVVVPHLTSAQVQGAVYADSRDIRRMSPRRSFTGWLRRAIQIRDLHCQHPAGCDEPIARCDVDHIIPDRHGGPTSYDNGRLQCTTHNRDQKLHDRAPPAG